MLVSDTYVRPSSGGPLSEGFTGRNGFDFYEVAVVPHRETQIYIPTEPQEGIKTLVASHGSVSTEADRVVGRKGEMYGGGVTLRTALVQTLTGETLFMISVSNSDGYIFGLTREEAAASYEVMKPELQRFIDPNRNNGLSREVENSGVVYVSEDVAPEWMTHTPGYVTCAYLKRGVK